jgi:hypothetical protein
MRHHSLARLTLLSLIIIALASCKTEKEDLVTEPISSYFPLATGKYITYRLDSMVITNFNKTIETHRYQLKEEVDAQVTDNLGRPSYRIFRYLRDSLGTTPWQPIGTYMVTPLGDQLEVVEDNLRFIKLHLPINLNFSWKGNRYLPTEPYPAYAFNNDVGMQDWDFYYDSMGETFSYGNKTYQDVLTVEQIDESLNIPVTAPSSYGYRSRAVEKYAKGIGLVYREYTLYDYQPGASSGNNTYWGFGIKKWMIDHN